MQEQLQRNTHVFLGQVLSATDSTFEVQLLEEFKGHVPRPRLHGRISQSNCGMLVAEGVWIFYTTMNAAGTMPELTYCSFSGNLTEPYLLVMPPDPSLAEDSLAREHYYQEKRTELRALFLQHWLTEYPLLVAYRRQHVPASSAITVSTWLAAMALGVALLTLLIVLLKRKGAQLGAT
ncbi:hypothetical protein [Hymenobacter sp. UYP22]|uniref:hypothetical protein n=1 Tax=Hymenobacter sp. UYP22 TaxID=3156348 RepID=UPI003398555D